MSATQLERKQQASGQRALARADGYRHGLYGVETLRLIQHPDYRFAYDAGYQDGALSRERSMAGAS